MTPADLREASMRAGLDITLLASQADGGAWPATALLQLAALRDLIADAIGPVYPASGDDPPGLVARLREDGATWQSIGNLTGYTAEGARKRWGVL